MATIRTSCEVQALTVLGLGERVRPRQKPAADGRPAHTTGTVLMVSGVDPATGEVFERSERMSSVHVIEAPAAGVYEAGERYTGEGFADWTPYLPDGARRITYSVVVERLVPATRPVARRRSEPSG